MISITKFQKVSEPFTDPVTGARLTKEQFVSLKDLVDTPIEILDIHDSENQYGKGMSFSFRIQGTDSIRYSMTHSDTLMDVLGNEDLRQALSEGETAEATIVYVDSTKTPGRKFYRFA